MKKIIGSEVGVHLKTTTASGSAEEIYGILIDIDDENMYIQSCDMNSPTVYVVPRINVSYCTVSTLPKSGMTLNAPAKQKEPEQKIIQLHENEPEPQQPIAQSLFLDVYVNATKIAHIPVPPTFNFNRWSDNIMKIAYGNPDVRYRLENRTIKTLDYSPGELYIDAEDPPNQEVENEGLAPDQQDTSNDNTYSMTMNGNAASQFLPGEQMVAKLNALVSKRGKKE